MTTVIHVNANLQWRAERGRGSDHWIGFCDALGISTEAESLDELHSLIPEAIHLLMVDLFEDNELDEFLHERGWSSNVGDHADGRADLRGRHARPSTSPEHRLDRPSHSRHHGED